MSAKAEWASIDKPAITPHELKMSPFVQEARKLVAGQYRAWRRSNLGWYARMHYLANKKYEDFLLYGRAEI